jgi:sRNA-binding regulator protein Hfq
MADDDDADRWLHALSVDEAARRRSEKNDLRQLEAEARTLVEAIAAMASEGLQVRVRVAGVTRTGVVVDVGENVVELLVDGGGLLVASAAIDTVEPGPPLARPQRGARRSAADLQERLRLMHGEGRPVTVTLRDGSTLTGRLDTVGSDAVVLDRRPGRPRVYVALGSLALVSG